MLWGKGGTQNLDKTKVPLRGYPRPRLEWTARLNPIWHEFGRRTTKSFAASSRRTSKDFNGLQGIPRDFQGSRRAPKDAERLGPPPNIRFREHTGRRAFTRTITHEKSTIIRSFHLSWSSNIICRSGLRQSCHEKLQARALHIGISDGRLEIWILKKATRKHLADKSIVDRRHSANGASNTRCALKMIRSRLNSRPLTFLFVVFPKTYCNRQSHTQSVMFIEGKLSQAVCRMIGSVEMSPAGPEVGAGFAI